MLLDDKNKTNRNAIFSFIIYNTLQLLKYSNLPPHIISTLLNKICQILKIGPRKLHLQTLNLCAVIKFFNANLSHYHPLKK